MEHDAGPAGVAVVCETRGEILIAPDGYDLGPLCIKCGAADAPHRKVVKVTKAPWWLWLTCLGVCPWVILYFIVRRVSRHPVRLCSPCRSAWTRSWIWQVLLWTVLPIALVGVLVPVPLSDAAKGWIVIGGVVLIAAGVPMLFARARLTARAIEDGYAHLVGVSPAYVRALGVPAEGESASH